MKAHLCVISTGVIAFGILLGNFTFNVLQCERWNNRNDTSIDHKHLREWCQTSGTLLTASPWIVFAILCSSISVYYLMLLLSHHQYDNVDNAVYDIRVSLSTLSLDHNKQCTSGNGRTIHSNTSWFSELSKLNLLQHVNSSLPVAMDTTNKQIISPPKLKPHGTPLAVQSNNEMTKKIVLKHKQYYIITIIILSCLLSVSVTCNIVLIYWIT